MIFRGYPDIKYIDFPIHPYNFSQTDIKEYTSLDSTIKNKINIWMSGINPNTSRKIAIGGETYIAIGKKNKWLKYEKIKHMLDKTETYNIKMKNYMKKCNIVTKKNKKITEYKKELRKIIKKINANSYNDYVSFKNIKFKKPDIVLTKKSELKQNNTYIHSKCGDQVNVVYVSCNCNDCINMYGCENYVGTYIYKCDVCDYVSMKNEYEPYYNVYYFNYEDFNESE